MALFSSGKKEKNKKHVNYFVICYFRIFNNFEVDGESAVIEGKGADISYSICMI